MRLSLLPLALSVLAVASCGRTEPASEPPAAAPSAPAVSVPAVAIYVTNEQSGDLSVIDGATNEVVRTIPVGSARAGHR